MSPLLQLKGFATLTLLAVAAPAQAAILFGDSFDYTAGSAITSANGGTGFNGAYTGVGSITGPGQTYAGITSAGNTFSTNGSDGGAFRLLTTPIGTDSGVVFVRLLASNTSALAAQYAGLSFFNGGSEELFLGKPFNSASYGFDVSGQTGGTVLSSSPISANTTLLVYRLSFGTLNDKIDLFVNPGITLPGAPDATFTTADNTAFPATFDRIRLQSGNNAPTFNYDEIRAATTASEVLPVPEPSSTGLLVGGVALLGSLRRRKARIA